MYDWLLIGGVVLWAGLAAWYLRRPAASAFHPATYYLIFHGILFTLRPILAWLQGFSGVYQTYQFTPTITDKIVVLLGADLALLVFMLVSVRVGHLPFTRAPGTARREVSPRFTWSLLLTAGVCLPIAIASLIYSWQIPGSGGGTTWDYSVGVAINTKTSGYFSDAVLMLGPIALLFAWAGRFRWWSFSPLLLFILLKAGTGGRWPFVMAALSAGLYWMFERRLRWFPARAVVGAFALLLVFTVIGADRGAGIRHWATGQQVATSGDLFQERPLESMDYGNLEFNEFIVHAVPRKTGTYDYFLSNLQIFTEPVPRILWPGKPVGPPIRMFNLFDYGFPIGMTYSVSGVGWMEAGWIGVVLWAALFGWAYGRAYNAFVRSDQDAYKTAAFIILLPISLQVFRDGVLLTVLKTSFYPLVPILVWRAFRGFDVAARTRPSLAAAS